MTKRPIIFLPLFLISLLLIMNDQPLFGQQESRVIGEAFGKPVTEKEFGHYLKLSALFPRTEKRPGTEQDIRKEAWEYLVYGREAKEADVNVTNEEIDAELKKVLSGKNIAYGSKDYPAQVSKEFNADVATFEGLVKDLAIINKFIKMKQEPEVSVSEEEMRQRFLSEYNSFESEYIVFDNKADSENFIEKVKKNPGLWKDTYDEKKANGQKGAAWINIMSLGALVDLWKIPEEDAYRILSHKEGDFITANFYYGIAVFRLLYKKEANQKEFDEKRKKYYKETIAANKKRKLSKEYFDDVFKRAAYKDYAVEEKRAAKEEALERKSLIALQTNKGEIDVRLFPDIAPKACENFIALIEKGYYNNTIFHRVKKGFMIQGGDPTGTGAGGESIWKKPFEDEVRPNINFDRAGILAMVNSGPNTNKGQFFITTAPATWLDQKHTIFGEVVSGYETVEKIENVPTDPSDRPKEEVKIIKAYIAQ